MELLKKILRAGRGPAEKETTLQDVIENLRLLSKGERDLSEFYQLCGDVLADDKSFWHDLAESERAHAGVALAMADLVAKEPGKYRPGRSFSVVSIRLFGLHLSGLVESMRAGEIKQNELLSVAADIEGLVVELSYGEMAETEVPEYLAMARRLEKDTGEHRQVLEDKIKKASGGA